MKAPTIRVIPGGLITTGFSARRSQRRNLQRRWTTCDTLMKSSSNPEWYRLPAHCRLAHDEIERYLGRSCSGGRLRMARRFSQADWLRVALTTRRTVEILVEAGWAAWDGDDLILLHGDDEGERAYIDRVLKKKKNGRKTREKHPDGGDPPGYPPGCLPGYLGQKSPRQMAETSHFEDTAPAPAPASIRSDLRSSPRRETSLPPPPPPPGARGGGGGVAYRPRGNRSGSDDGDPAFSAWLQLYTPDTRGWADGDRASAARVWRDLGMTDAGARRCMEFTERALRNRQNSRDAGAFRAKPAKFLWEVWKPELERRRKNHDEKNGKTGAATSADAMSAYLADLGGEA